MVVAHWLNKQVSHWFLKEPCPMFLLCVCVHVFECVFFFPCTKAQVEYNWESKLSYEIWISFTLWFFVDKANCYLSYSLPQVSSYHLQVQRRGPSVNASCPIFLGHLVITLHSWLMSKLLDHSLPSGLLSSSKGIVCTGPLLSC